MAPVALGIEIAEVKARLLSEADVCNSAGDFTRHERAPTARALVVKEDAVASIYIVGLAIILRNPEGVQFCDAVGAAWVERGVLVLRDSLDETVKLGRRRLIESHMFLEATGAHGVKQTQGTKSVDIASILGHVEGDLDVRLCAEIVDLGWLDLCDDIHKVGAIRQIPMVKLKLVLPYCQGGISTDIGM